MSELNTYTHVLKAPFIYEDKEYAEITLDFGKLTGNDALAIEEEMRSEGVNFIRNEAYDGGYQLIAAAKASGVAKDVLLALPIRDNRAIKIRAKRYLLDGGNEIARNLPEKLDILDGNTADVIDSELRAEGHVVVTEDAFDTKYCVKLAAMATDMTEDQITGLPMNEFLEVKMSVRLFLLGLA